jgi:hypothetical protein
MWCILPNYFPFIKAQRKKNVKDCNWSKLMLEISSYKKGARTV